MVATFIKSSWSFIQFCSTHWHIRRRIDEIGQLTGTFVDGQTKLVNSLAHSSTDRRNWSTHWHIRRRTDEIGQLTGEFVGGQTIVQLTGEFVDGQTIGQLTGKFVDGRRTVNQSQSLRVLAGGNSK